MSEWFVRYDASRLWAERYGCCRVVEADSEAAARVAAGKYEGDGWTLTFTAVRLARPTEVERQRTIDHWFTCAKQARAGRWMGL